ncbi:unnamed protein product [Microthlaspi erraticum]|uniref:F-box domain-containing protein n=1 Tax=Microthlaspi erraticum TaxID=1685480 RepID=A0A6D2HNH3_9BRAS|nr:unnamed protein product [Microthlaspi erraticum]
MERSILSSDVQDKGVLVDAVDLTSKLPNDLLIQILSNLSIEEAMRTSVMSHRWVDLWKETTMSHLHFDLRRFAKVRNPLSNTHHAARSMTKVINNHHGHLERCTLFYYSYQCQNVMVQAWIRALIHEKRIKHLTLENFPCPFKPNVKPITLDLPPSSFSHPNLESLILRRYNFETPHAFSNCCNLKNLTLSTIFAEIEVFNVVLASCPSLEVLLVDIDCHTNSGHLKIENRKLKFLYLSSYNIDGIEVSSPILEILTIGSLSCEMENLVVANPRLHFHRNFWNTGKLFPHTSYNISCPDQEKNSIGQEYINMMDGSNDLMREFASLSVSVDLTNTKEVEMLQEVLVAWPGEMEELEILFKKSNAPMKQGKNSIGRINKKFWKETKPFPDACFSVCTVWLFNFSGSKEEYKLASRLIRQGTVIRTMKIKPLLSYSPRTKLEIEGAITKLKELPESHIELDIILV